jgi:hypothetical protein
VALSIVVAAALLVAVNLLAGLAAERADLRWDLETAGRYGLSESSRLILQQVDEPVRLTSIYTSEEAGRESEEYLPRVRDLLAEMARAGDRVEAVNISSDADKLDVLTRLRARIEAGPAAEHKQAIDRFGTLASTLSVQIEQEAAIWDRYPAGGYLTKFGVPRQIKRSLEQWKGNLRDLSADYRRRQERHALPDYPAMVDEAAETLRMLQGDLATIRSTVADLAEVRPALERARPGLEEATEKYGALMDKLPAALGKAGDPVPDEPGKVLEELAKVNEEAAAAARAIQGDLEALASVQAIRFAAAWRVDRPGPMGLTRTLSLPEYFGGLARQSESLAQQVRSLRKNFKAERLKEVIQGLRETLPPGELARDGKEARQAIDRLLDELLAELDPATRRVFEQARGGEYLQEVLGPVGQLLRRLEDLGDLPDQQELIERVGEENIILVEVGDRTGVVSFEEVWPRAPEALGGDEDEPRRLFNGDMAVAGRILSLATGPMAEVVLTYFEDMPPPRMRQFRPAVVGPLPTYALTELRDRLERANLKVTDWNLAEATEPEPPEAATRPAEEELIEPPAKDDDLPRVLLVLPPGQTPPPNPRMPMPLPRWSARHRRSITRLIDQGTPAMFLTSWRPPDPYGVGEVRYEFADYLREQWGMDLKIGHRVFRARPDPESPGKFLVPITSLSHMSFSSFSDHPIGEPLRARRFYWLNACPILRADPAGKEVAVADLLNVPKDAVGVWGAADYEQVVRNVERREPLVPAAEEDDIAPPFALAVLGSRGEGEGAPRVLLSSMGDSFLDGYVTEPVYEVRPDGTIEAGMPPTGNIDLLVNAAYFLTGHAGYIGAGPAAVEPIKLISRPTMTGIQLGFGIGVLAIFGLGVAVMVARRG